MKKVVVLGCVGMAGHVVTDYLSGFSDYDVVGVARSKGKHVNHILDVTNFDELENLFETIRPECVINCIGSLVSASKTDVAAAILINSYLPHFLSKLGDKLNFKLIHISTDCVFSGSIGGYKEYSFRDGDDNYARTKALGEVDNEKDLTIRTSIIGPELKSNGTGLLDWFLKQSGEINGYSNAYWSGVTTLELAKSLREFIKQDITGLFQLCPQGKISKYDLLNSFSNIWGSSVKVNMDSSYSVDKSLISIRTDFDYNVPDFDIMLNELYDWMSLHADDYVYLSK